MKGIIEGLSKPLTKEDLELRVGSNSAKSFTLLVYKTARVDRKRLDEVCPRWSNRHYLDENKNVCCGISIWDDGIKQWISRSDVGTESFTEKEKGSYSDSFKRAGFRWGIGTNELYNVGLIRIMWDMKESEFKDNTGRMKKKFSPIDFWPNNLEISKYEVVEGKPEIEIKYDGRVIFPTTKGKKQGFKGASSDKPVKMGNAKANTEDLATIETLLINTKIAEKDTEDKKLWFCEQFDIKKFEDLLKRDCAKAYDMIVEAGEPDDIP